MKTLADTLHPDIVQSIRTDQASDPPANADQDLLTWEDDCTCGIDCMRVSRVYAFVAQEWPDVADDVLAAAVRQIFVICYG